MKIVDLCRMHNISDATFYTWRTKYGGLEVSDAKRLNEVVPLLGPPLSVFKFTPHTVPVAQALSPRGEGLSGFTPFFVAARSISRQVSHLIGFRGASCCCT